MKLCELTGSDANYGGALYVYDSNITSVLDERVINNINSYKSME